MFHNKLATPKTYLAFDYGTKKIGLAIGNDLIGTAQPLPAIETARIFKSNGSIVTAVIGHLIGTWKVDHLVFGAPLNAAGQTTRMSQKIHKLGKALASELNLPVSFADERYSSATADHLLRAQQGRGKKISAKKIALRDSLAAQLILEGYFAHTKQ